MAHNRLLLSALILEPYDLTFLILARFMHTVCHICSNVSHLLLLNSTHPFEDMQLFWHCLTAFSFDLANDLDGDKDLDSGSHQCATYVHRSRIKRCRSANRWLQPRGVGYASIQHQDIYLEDFTGRIR